jgi:hypothetical protein
MEIVKTVVKHALRSKGAVPLHPPPSRVHFVSCVIQFCLDHSPPETRLRLKDNAITEVNWSMLFNPIRPGGNYMNHLL